MGDYYLITIDRCCYWCGEKLEFRYLDLDLNKNFNMVKKYKSPETALRIIRKHNLINGSMDEDEFPYLEHYNKDNKFIDYYDYEWKRSWRLC